MTKKRKEKMEKKTFMFTEEQANYNVDVEKSLPFSVDLRVIDTKIKSLAPFDRLQIQSLGIDVPPGLFEEKKQKPTLENKVSSSSSESDPVESPITTPEIKVEPISQELESWLDDFLDS